MSIFDENTKPDEFQKSQPSGVNSVQHFSRLTAGAGTERFEVSENGLFMGAGTFADAPFKVSYAGAVTATNATLTGSLTVSSYIKIGQTAYDTGTGFWVGDVSGTPKLSLGNSAGNKLTWDGTALALVGSITATGGSITGDLTVTGSLFSDDGSAYQIKLLSGKMSFLKTLVEKAYIKTASGSNGLQLSSTGSIFFTDINGTPNAELDSASNLKFSNDAYIRWNSGRKITADASSMTADGNWLVLGGCRATGFTARIGSTDYDGITDSFQVVTNVRTDSGQLQKKAVTLTYKKGLLTTRSSESDWEDQGAV